MWSTSIGEYACRWTSRRHLLGQPQPALVVLERPVGMDARLHADLGGAELDGLLHAAHELVAVVLVGVGRAAALAEAAERAADHADVGDVDVAVDDEGHRRRPPARRAARRRPGACPRSPPGASRRTGRSARRRPSHSPSRPLAIAPGTRSRRIGRSSRRPEPRRGMKLQYLGLIASSTPWLEPLGRPCTAGTRTAARSARSPPAWSSLRIRWGEGNGCSGEMWSPLADRPPRSVAPSSTSGSHQSERLGGIWMPTSGISRRHSRTSTRMSSSVIASPSPAAAARPARRRRRALGGVGYLRRLRPVVARVRHEVLEDHLLEVAVLGVHRGQRLERLRPAPRASRRCPRGSRW